ncbi:MAG: hypothetical protein AB2A00_31360 [Myxococcota bacterium]
MRHPVQALLLASLVAVGFTGLACATPGERKTYEPPTRSIPASQDAVLDAVLRHVKQQGWSVVRADRVAGLVETVTPEKLEDGVRSRERWYFLVGESQLQARLVLEVQWEPYRSPWESEPDVVCDEYGYYRETQHLEDIARLASVPSEQETALGPDNLIILRWRWPLAEP